MGVLEKALNDHGIPYYKIDEQPFYRLEPVRSVINILKLLVNPNNQYLIRHLIDKNIINQEALTILTDQSQTRPVTDTIRLIRHNLNKTVISKGEQQLKQLLNKAEAYGENLGEFLKIIALGGSIDSYNADIERVTLMTLHAAKGLEFGCVFIAGCEDGLIPYSLYQDMKSDLNEECRLLYVGMTRAKKLLCISYAQKRFLMGKYHHLQKSPFLNRIEKDLIELSKSSYHKKNKKEDNQLSLF
jgi:superfamily I DNA/RNA helicase